MGVCISSVGMSDVAPNDTVGSKPVGFNRPRRQVDLLAEPDVVKSELPPGVQRFNKEAFGEFGDPASSFLVWRDLLGLSEPPHHRVELYFSRLHAAVTLQRYLILLDRKWCGVEGDDDPGLLDLGVYIHNLHSTVSEDVSFLDIAYSKYVELFAPNTRHAVLPAGVYGEIV